MLLIIHRVAVAEQERDDLTSEKSSLDNERSSLLSQLVSIKREFETQQEEMCQQIFNLQNEKVNQLLFLIPKNIPLFLTTLTN